MQRTLPPRRSTRLIKRNFTTSRSENPAKYCQLFDSASDKEEETTMLETEETNPSLAPATHLEVQKQIDELRLQLEAARASAETEKEERIRLQELINLRQEENSAETSVVLSSVPIVLPTVSPPMNVTASQYRNNGTPATATSAVTFTSQCMPNTGSTMYPPLMSTASQSSSHVQSVPSYLTPLNQLQPFGQPTSMPQPSSQSMPPLHASHFTSHAGRNLHDLPNFTGRPEDWPMFSTAFQESTTMFGYSNVENIFRLQKCIKGDAKEVVEALLIHPNNVYKVMAALEFRFGRPECLLRSQLMKIREVPNIPEGKLELLIPFSTKVQNLATFLESSGLHQHLANPTLIEELVNKLPMSKRLEWAQRSVYMQPFPTVKHFDDWLSGIARLVCIVTPGFLQPQARDEQRTRSRNVLHANNSQQQSTTVCQHRNPKQQREVPYATQTPSAADNSDLCRHCKRESHAVVNCRAYSSLDVRRKWEFVKRNRLCFGCLRHGHQARSCRSRKRCGIDDCARNHHPSLHEETPENKPTMSLQEVDHQESSKPILSCNAKVSPRILFRILPVRLYNNEVMVSTFALLDEGSSVTIISADLANELGLKGQNKPLNLQWFGKEKMTEKSILVNLQISADKNGSDRFALTGVQTVSKLNLPTQSLTKSDLDSLYRHTPIHLLQDFENAQPQLLIGLDNSHLGAPLSTILSTEAEPIVVETKLGWVVYGRTKTNVPKGPDNEFILYSSQSKIEEDLQLNVMMEDYFAMENFGAKKPAEELLSVDDKRALSILSSVTKRVDDRFQTGLLWKEEAIETPESLEMARRRLWSLENKMSREPEFAIKYKDIITSYVKKGYARKLTRVEAEKTTPRTWYLPHFGVKNPYKPNKIRLVFDAAASVDGVSLNSLLLKGPDNLKPLLSILFNFRLRPIAVTGDIREMFHQIKMQSEDQESQRFLWRNERDKQIDVYQMQSMIFGANCSPCSANFVKNLNAANFANEYPRAVKAIVDHHYVDDYVDCFDSEAEAIEVTRAVVFIHKAGGFELQSFASNSPKVLRSISDVTNENRHSQVVDMNIHAVTEKVLGMYWEPVEDVFTFAFKFPRVSKDVMADNKCPTKREFLSIVMSIFDPFGMIANITIHLKLMLQSAWKHGVSWDEPIPHEIFENWKKWKMEIPKLTQLKIPRCHDSLLSKANKVDLHTFVDASEEAFSAVTYLRAEVGDRIIVSFINGKTKCAPKKLISMPRLELSAAVLGIRLCNSVIESHELRFGDRTFWSDSKTCINWLRMDPRRNKPFVAFRVAEILENSKVSQWRWIPTKSNPADDGTRAKYPPRLEMRSKWLVGPSFLRQPEDAWPAMPDDISCHTCPNELRLKSLLHVNTVSTFMIDTNRFSKYLKLKRTMAWVLRFVKSCQRKVEKCGELSVAELLDAEFHLCRQAQMDVFENEIGRIQRNLPLEKNSAIYKLTPYLDDVGLLRVYGRIDAATSVPFSARRPIILPKGHPLTKLIIAHYHNLMRHQNDDSIVNEIRHKFWVPCLRTAVRRAKKECQYCHIRTVQPLPPLMGQLPKDRLTPFVRPFTYTGLDYFGPVLISIGRRKEKRWIALFTCLTIRAIHLEIAADLSTDACIMCIRNFVNRRGVPLRLRSDNGTNFIGAKNEMLTTEIFDNDAIKTELSSKGIEWVFNCPANPHAGGIWERLVRCVKRVLSHILRELAPKPETLLSSLIEAENIVNSRPLTHLPVTSEEEEPLTPNHFLLGGPNSTQTPGRIDAKALCLHKQWRVSQQIKDRFWRRWINEYLPVLTRRCKWFENVPPVAVGNLVLICDADVPRSRWIRGRVLRVFPGRDRHVRSAEVKTRVGVLRRPVVKLAVLDVSEATCLDSGASRGVGC